MSVWLTVVVGLASGIVGGIVGTHYALWAVVRGMAAVREREDKRTTTNEGRR